MTSAERVLAPLGLEPSLHISELTCHSTAHEIEEPSPLSVGFHRKHRILAAERRIQHLHFSGCGGSTVAAFAETQLAPVSKADGNFGCAANQGAFRAALVAGRQRCSCADPSDWRFQFQASENPVMAALRCPGVEYCSWLNVPSTLLEDTAPPASLDLLEGPGRSYTTRSATGEQLGILPSPEQLAAGRPKVQHLSLPTTRYWVVLRPPVERVLSRSYKMGWPEPLVTKLVQETVWLRTHPRAGCQELAGTASVSNFYVRSFGGPDTFKLPLNGVNRTHFKAASQELDRFDVVLPLSNLSSLPLLLGLPDIPLRYVDVGWHRTEQPRQPPKKMMRLLEKRNIWDGKLYEHAVELFRKAVARAARSAL
jgi:hypothetical protein